MLSSTAAVDHLTYVNLLVKKANSIGCIINKIGFKDSPEEGVGIFSTHPVSAGEPLITVPFNSCISVQGVLNSELAVIFEDTPDLLKYPDEVLCIAIMHALDHPSCTWAEHVATFPKRYNSTINWSTGELAKLSPCSVFHLSHMIKKQLRTDWESIHEPIKHQHPELLSSASFESYVWAMSSVYSRAIGVHRKGVYVRLIAPLIDMANHSPAVGKETADTFSYSDTHDTISFISAVPVAIGEQCFAVYGEYPNSKLAMNYGFVIGDNPQRRVDIWPKVTSSISCYDAKKQIIDADVSLREQTYDFEGTLVDGHITSRLLRLVRILQMTANEMSVSGLDRVSRRNEVAAFESIQAILQARLGDADAASLKEYRRCRVSCVDREYMALQVTVDERDIVMDCLREVQEKLIALEKEEEEEEEGS